MSRTVSWSGMLFVGIDQSTGVEIPKGGAEQAREIRPRQFK